MKRLLFSISLCLMLLLLFQTAVCAGTVTLQASPAKVQAGGDVTLSGTASVDGWVSVRGIVSDGSIVYFNGLRADSAGAFSDVFRVPDDGADILTIVAGSGSDTVKATVEITAKPAGGSSSGGRGKTQVKPVVVIPESGLPAGATIIFNDVDSAAWYAKAVNYLAERGIVSGIGGGFFSPDGNLTRGQFMVMVMKAYGIQPAQISADNFTDAGGAWYTAYLAEAKRLGLAYGIGNNQYAPERTISRQEAFTLLYRTLTAMDKLPSATNDKTLTDFGDSERIATWASDAMGQLLKAGVINGSDGVLNPEGITSRAQMAQLLYNLLLDESE